MLDPAAVLPGPRPRAAPGRRGAPRAGPGAGRRRHRQDPGDHPPDRPRRRHRRLRSPPRCWPSPSPPARPARCASRLRRLGAEGVQARTFHSAALRQLRYFWPHVHGTELPTLIESKLGLLATAARRQRVRRRPGATLRDLASEIEWAKVSNVRPDDYARIAAAPRPLRHRRRPRDRGAGSSAATRTSSAAQGRMDMEDVLLLTAGMLADDERVAAQVRRQYKWFVVDEFQDVSPHPVGAARPLARRPRRALRGRRPGADDLLLRRRRRRLPARLPGEVPRHHLDRAGPQLPLHPRGRRRRQHPARRHRQRAASSCAPSGPPAPRSRYTSHPDEVAEAEAVAAADRSGSATRAARRRGRRAVPHQRPVRGLRGGAGRPRHPLRRPRRRPVLRPARGARGGHPAARRRPLRRRSPTTTWSTPCAAILAGDGLDPRGAGRPRPDPRPLGVPGRRWSTRPPSSPTTGASDLGAFVDDLDRRAAEQHAPVADGVTLATFHAAKGLEWDAVFLCGLQDGTLPITYADTPAAIEEERRLLYVGMTRARRDLAALLGAGPQPGRPRHPQAVAVPRPAAARRQPRSQPTGRAAARSPAAASAASRWPPARRRSAAGARTARRPTTRSCSSGCASGAASGPREESVPALRRVHRRHAAADRRAQARSRREALLRINGIGRTKLTATARTFSRSSADLRRAAEQRNSSRNTHKIDCSPYTGAAVPSSRTNRTRTHGPDKVRRHEAPKEVARMNTNQHLG